MTFEDPLDVAAHCARAALGMMDRHRVPARPDNFRVWYAFVANRQPELSDEINRILATGAKFTEEVNAELVARFFPAGAVAPATAANEARSNELQAVSQHIEEAIGRLLGHVATASRGASDYGETLDSFSGALADGTEVADLLALVGQVREQTAAMVAVNLQLEQRLASSASEVSRLREDLDQLRHQATRDHLTGLANRRLFDVSLREAIATLGERPLTLLMIDIDFFKKFNDSHGHQLGDQVLKLVARSLNECVKGKDVSARYGGEEFAVVLPDTRLADGMTVAESIRSSVAGRKLTNRRTGEVLGQVTLSAGAAQFRPGESLGALIQRADEALYLAKRLGRNRVCSETDLDG